MQLFVRFFKMKINNLEVVRKYSVAFDLMEMTTELLTLAI
jgi:hypothetical protein